jgi:hypothetical protein
MQDVLTWGAIVVAGSSIVAVVRFWMELFKECQQRLSFEVLQKQTPSLRGALGVLPVRSFARGRG